MGLIPYPFSIDWFSYTHIAKLQTKLKREKKRRIQCECLTRKHRSFPFVLNLVFIPRNTHGFRNPKRAIKSCVWGKKALCFHSFQYKHVKLHEKAPHSMFIETGCKAAACVRDKQKKNPQFDTLRVRCWCTHCCIVECYLSLVRPIKSFQEKFRLLFACIHIFGNY